VAGADGAGGADCAKAPAVQPAARSRIGNGRRRSIVKIAWC